MAASPQESPQRAFLPKETPLWSVPRTPQSPVQPELLPSSAEHGGHAQARGIAQAFGLHPAIATLTIAVDLMLFGKDGLLALIAPVTGGLSFLLALMISACAGAGLGFIAYFAQKHWYGDDRTSALIKASMVGFLTAIPTSIPGIIYGSFGLIGLFRRKPCE